MTRKRPAPLPAPGKPGTARSDPSRPLSAFGEDYYRRFYKDPATRVRAGSAQSRLADFVFGYLSHVGVPVRRMLDLGCGLGHWSADLARKHPRATYTGVEISPYLCARYGWEQGSAADFRGRGRYDLIICQSVLQYLPDEGVKAAVANMARLCRGALFLEIITAGDWRDHCDQRVTDGNIHMRTESWYRKALGRHFRSAGGGVFLPLDSPVVLYELEQGRF
jgi:SAM-dependent methyltransferase